MSEFKVNVVFFYFFLKTPPLHLSPPTQMRNQFNRKWGGGCVVTKKQPLEGPLFQLIKDKYSCRN